MSHSVKMTTIPYCDLCATTEAVVDAPTNMGPWAYMCDPCWHTHGATPGRTGTGVGQMIVQDDE